MLRATPYSVLIFLEGANQTAAEWLLAPDGLIVGPLVESTTLRPRIGKIQALYPLELLTVMRLQLYQRLSSGVGIKRATDDGDGLAITPYQSTRAPGITPC